MINKPIVYLNSLKDQRFQNKNIQLYQRIPENYNSYYPSIIHINQMQASENQFFKGVQHECKMNNKSYLNVEDSERDIVNQETANDEQSEYVKQSPFIRNHKNYNDENKAQLKKNNDIFENQKDDAVPQKQSVVKQTPLKQSKQRIFTPQKDYFQKLQSQDVQIVDARQISQQDELNFIIESQNKNIKQMQLEIDAKESQISNLQNENFNLKAKLDKMQLLIDESFTEKPNINQQKVLLKHLKDQCQLLQQEKEKILEEIQQRPIELDDFIDIQEKQDTEKNLELESQIKSLSEKLAYQNQKCLFFQDEAYRLKQQNTKLLQNLDPSKNFKLKDQNQDTISDLQLQIQRLSAENEKLMQFSFKFQSVQSLKSYMNQIENQFSQIKIENSQIFNQFKDIIIQQDQRSKTYIQQQINFNLQTLKNQFQSMNLLFDRLHNEINEILK